MLNTIPDHAAPLYLKLNARYDALYGNGSSSTLDYSVYSAFDAVLAFVYAFAYTIQQLSALPSALTGAYTRAALLSNVSFAGASGHITFGADAYVNSTFTLAAFYPLSDDAIKSNAVVNLTTVGNATVRSYSTVPFAAFQNSSNPTPFWLTVAGIGRASAAPVDGFKAAAGRGVAAV